MRLESVRSLSTAALHYRSGFTLVEVAVAGAIAAVLLLAIGATFHSASIAWGHGVGRAARALQAEVVLERLSEELQQAVRIGMPDVGFVGRRNAVVWWVAAGDGALGGGAPLVRVGYRYDGGSRSVARGEVALPEATAIDRGDGRTVLTDVASCAFAFPYRSGGAVVWRDEWRWGDHIPAAVRVALSVDQAPSSRGGTGESFTIERIVPIPHGVVGDDSEHSIELRAASLE